MKNLKNLLPISQNEKINFTKNLGVMLKAGLSLDQSLSILSKQSQNHKFKKVILNLQKEVQSGHSLADSLALYPRIFSQFYINMVRVGEEGGIINQIAKELHKQMQKTGRLKSKTKGALIYPAIIIITMIIIGVIMMIAVVPKLLDMLSQFGTQLPWTTKLIIAVSRFLTSRALIIFPAFIALITALIWFFKSRKGKPIWHKIIITCPILGKLSREYNNAMLARNLNSLIESGVPIVEALKTSANTLNNYWYQKSLETAAKKVQTGKSLFEIMKDYPKLYPPMVTEMIEVGEETGQLNELLSHIADYYEEELDQATRNLSVTIEPVLMVFIGGLVTFFALSMLQPMYSILQNVG